jgi:hypothetical protein
MKAHVALDLPRYRLVAARVEAASRPRPTPLRWAFAMSWVIAALMIAASLAGLLVDGLYKEGAWAREALRGGDLVTLVLVAPLLIGSLVMTRRGSRRAEVVWLGALAYSVYDYAYYVFGSTFNDVFLLHIALFSLSVFALICALPSVDAGGIAARLRTARPARWAGGFLVTVGVLQGLLWVFVVVRNAFTGEVIDDIPVTGQHLVLALDLGLLVPSLIVSGVLLFRRTAMGFVLGAAMAVMGAAYQLNLMLAGVFQANANVRGVSAFPPESLFLTATFLVAAFVLVRGRGRTDMIQPVHEWMTAHI